MFHEDTAKEFDIELSIDDLSTSSEHLSVRRLLGWSKDVGEGLKYLTDEGVIHRDVALRNILLTNNDKVKIADFGLAVKLPNPITADYKENSEYVSRGNKPIPFRWMAIESLRDRKFSSKTDVWAFGVTLWEIFSLGKEPYGSTVATELIFMLEDGGRLEECQLSPAKVNALMRQCWAKDPVERPNIQETVNVLDKVSFSVSESVTHPLYLF